MNEEYLSTPEIDEEYLYTIDNCKKDLDKFIKSLNLKEDDTYMIEFYVEKYVGSIFLAMKNKENKKLDAIKQLVNNL